MSKPPAAPKAKRVDKILEIHGHRRNDPYYWLRDDTRRDPGVLSYLRAENDYTEAVLAPAQKARELLFEEMVSRIKKDDSTVPVLVDGYWHYVRYRKGREHPIFCRKKEHLDAPEEILLDGNLRAGGHAYYRAGEVETSRRGDRLAWSEDTVSRRIYKIHVKDLKTGKMFDEVLEGTDGTIAWADDSEHFFYVKKQEGTLREFQVWRHRVGTPQSLDVLVYEEQDDTFWVTVYRSKSNRFMIIHSTSTLTEEARVLSTDDPTGEFQVFAPRERGHEYQVDHAGNHFYVRSNLDAVNFRIFSVPGNQIGSREHWRELLPHRPDVLLKAFEVFRDFLVVSERAEANTRLRVMSRERPGSGHLVRFDQPAFLTWIGDNPAYETTTLRFGYSSFSTPDSIYDYDMQTRQKTLKKREEVVGGHRPEEYQSERLWATARDGKQVPISLVYRKDLDRTRPQPLYLYGYGAYGSSTSAYFLSPRLSLLDRGFIYAVAHVRGSDDLGRSWYQAGKLENQENTFTDFIDCARHLHKLGYSTPGLTVGSGGSAGGLLIGAVANRAPESFAALVAYVPFVDVVTTMLDESIPLTTFEYDEWGNPNQEPDYRAMLAYSPYDHVKKQRYPDMLVLAGLHDSQVQYWEPAKWVARLRHHKQGDDLLLLHTNMDTGHSGPAGRFKRHRQRALEYAFILLALGLPLPG